MPETFQQADTVATEMCGVKLQLQAECGVYLPDQNSLLVADLHLGKEATFRRHGIPVPGGSSDGTLQSVTAMLESHVGTPSDRVG